MNQHVHYDLAAFEKKLRADLATEAAKPGDEFHRLQMMANEITIQFGLYLARLDNECVDETLGLNAACAVLASLIENLASDYDGDRVEVTVKLLNTIAEYAIRGGECLGTTHAPIITGGHA